ncbi:phiSA1p31-related protein [Streptomyces sp. CAU 1734]|uniref:phiSA1p31-related protein n=1 Tax=Streptomyces sp. CAU 1734 TaxID=3140360 RepID=UPI003260E1CF
MSPSSHPALPAPPPPATVVLSDGALRLSGWTLTELEPDYYGRVFMRLAGQVAEAPRVGQTTNHMADARLPGLVSPAPINVQVAVHAAGDHWTVEIEWLPAPPVTVFTRTYSVNGAPVDLTVPQVDAVGREWQWTGGADERGVPVMADETLSLCALDELHELRGPLIPAPRPPRPSAGTGAAQVTPPADPPAPASARVHVPSLYARSLARLGRGGAR